MVKREEKPRHPLWAGLPIAITFVVLIVVALFISTFDTDQLFAWAMIPQFVGLSTFLVGVFGLLSASKVKSVDALPTLTVPLALILAGGISSGGGWAAALGLALLGSTGLVMASRRPGGERDAVE